MRSLRAVLASMAAALAGCSDRDDMYQHARLKTFEAVPGGPHLATDVPPEGTVPREPSPLEAGPAERWTVRSLTTGRDRFDIYCAPCHARDGHGDGIVALHGFPRPPSLHEDHARALTDEQVLRIITLGLGKMPPYGDLVRPADRWRIVGYLRALQLSQHAPPELVREGAP